MKRLIATIAISALTATAAFAASNVTPPKGDTSADTNFSGSATTTDAPVTTGTVVSDAQATSTTDEDAGKTTQEALAPSGVDPKAVGDKQ